MAGVKPEDIARTIEQFQSMATQGVAALEQIDARLGVIESELGIKKGSLDGNENGTGNRTSGFDSAT